MALTARYNGSRPLLVVEIITVAWMHSDNLSGYPFVGPAFDTALADISVSYPRIQFNQRVIYSDPYRTCPEWATESDNRVAQFCYRDHSTNSTRRPDLKLFLSAGCADANGIAELANGLGRLVVFTGVSPGNIFDKLHFPSLISANFTSITMMQLIYARLLRMFQWFSVMTLSDVTGNLGYLNVAKYIQSFLSQDYSFPVHNDFRTGNMSSAEEMSPVLDLFQISSRVMLLFAEQYAVRNFMRHIVQRNMTDGSYVFVSLYPLPVFGKKKQDRTMFSSQRDETIERAFAVTLFLEIDPDVVPVKKTNLTATWKEISKTKYNYTYDPGEEISPTVLSSYAATSILGQVINDVLAHSPNFDWSDGGELAKRFLNRTFDTKVGLITMSSVGERLTMMRINYFDTTKSHFEVSLLQGVDLGKGLQIIQSPNATWPGPWPVPNEPKCGFRGDRPECHISQTQFRNTAVGIGSGILLLLMTLFIAGQRYLFWRQLTSPWWILDNKLLRHVPVRSRLTDLMMSAYWSRSESVLECYSTECDRIIRLMQPARPSRSDHGGLTQLQMTKPPHYN